MADRRQRCDVQVTDHGRRTPTHKCLDCAPKIYTKRHNGRTVYGMAVANMSSCSILELLEIICGYNYKIIHLSINYLIVKR